MPDESDAARAQQPSDALADETVLVDKTDSTEQPREVTTEAARWPKPFRTCPSGTYPRKANPRKVNLRKVNLRKIRQCKVNLRKARLRTASPLRPNLSGRLRIG